MKKAITLLFLSIFTALGMAAPALADECALVIEGNDAMQYNLKEMSVPATCKEVTVTLNHTGKMPVTAMTAFLPTEASRNGVVRGIESSGSTEGGRDSSKRRLSLGL